MTLLKIQTPEKAQNDVKEVYDFFLKNMGMIPAPMKLLSASPAQFNLQWRSLKYFMKHPTLNFAVLSTIRYLVAEAYDYVFCTHLNREFLKRQGLTDEQISAISNDPMQAPLEDRERLLVAFVMKAIKTPESVTQEDMESLRREGWNDSDILDAVMQGTVMVSTNTLMKAFKMDAVC